MVGEFYKNWQGTWFTMFLFTLSPNHFFSSAYVITVFISLGLLITSVVYLAYFYLIKKLGFQKRPTAVIVCMVLYLMIQYIPRTTSGIYWFNGIMHYSVPFFLAILAIIHSHKYMDNKRRVDYIILFISFLLLGGGSYLAPLAATMTVILIMISKIKIEKINIRERVFKCCYDRQNLWILLALIVELLGLIISFLAPGNKVRGGEEFNADLKWALQCIYYAIDRGIYLGEDYFLENGVTTIVYLFLAVIVWEQMKSIKKTELTFRFPLLFIIYMNGIYWALYTPEIYSRSDVSGGVPNTYFHVFLLITLANMIYVHGWLQKKLEACTRYKKINLIVEHRIKDRLVFFNTNKIIKNMIIISAIIVFIAVNRISPIKTTSEYCMEYIKSGELPLYLETRKEQHEILTTSLEEDVVIPEIEARYPLINMCLEENPFSERNIDRARYYNKNSVKAIMVNKK